MADEQNDQIEEAEDAPVEEGPAEETQAEAPVEDAPEPKGDVLDEAPAEDDEPVAEAEPEPAAEEPATEEPAAGEPATEVEAEAKPREGAEPDGAGPDEAAATRRKKKKRLPRALRPARTKVTRVKPAERKPVSRLPKPEHAKGRRQERQGKVVSAAMDKTIVVRVDMVKAHPRYKKVIRRSSKFHAHDEQNEAKVGDIVLIVETRPLSRMKRWRLQKVVEAAR